MTRTIYHSTIGDERVKELLAMPYAHARVNYYKAPSNYVYYNRSIYVDDDKMCMSHTTNAAKPGNNAFYMKRKEDFGLTYDRKTKKARHWFGKPMVLDAMDLQAISDNFINIEWLINFEAGYFLLKKPGLLGKVLSGKITNPRDLISHYIKYHLKLKISPEILYKFMRRTAGNGFDSVIYYLKVLENPELHLIDCLNNPTASQQLSSHYTYDLINQAYMLNRKIDHRWSESKMKQVHSDWTKEIMDIEMQYLEDKSIYYTNEPDRIPFDFKLVTNLKELYKIGKSEHHCIYTNYSHMIIKKEYFCLYGEIDGQNYTVGIHKHWETEKFVIDQIQSKYNGGCPRAYREVFDEFMLRNQDFFKANYKSIVEQVEHDMVPVF